MDPRARLTAGQVAAREGRYEEALREYEWFHDHALEHRQSLYGVRLSFALGYWMDLAKDYPEAQKKLEEIRDRKTAILASGGGNRELFHDVGSINYYLGEDDKTYKLFTTMLQTAPLLAPVCATLAMEAIVKAGDFALAERYCDPTEDALIRYSDRLNEDVADLTGDRRRKAATLDAYIHIYCDRVGTRMAILKGLGKSEEAALCREWAELLVESAAVRKRVAKKLVDTNDA
jgi:tetratricopeptide (TPR) repeat protein